MIEKRFARILARHRRIHGHAYLVADSMLFGVDRVWMLVHLV